MTDDIKKLEPYAPALTEVSLRTTKIKRLRAELNRELEGRRTVLAKARDNGAPREELAKAAEVSVVRVSQILAGGAK